MLSRPCTLHFAEGMCALLSNKQKNVGKLCCILYTTPTRTKKLHQHYAITRFLNTYPTIPSYTNIKQLHDGHTITPALHFHWCYTITPTLQNYTSGQWILCTYRTRTDSRQSDSGSQLQQTTPLHHLLTLFNLQTPNVNYS